MSTIKEKRKGFNPTHKAAAASKAVRKNRFLCGRFSSTLGRLSFLIEVFIALGAFAPHRRWSLGQGITFRYGLRRRGTIIKKQLPCDGPRKQGIRKKKLNISRSLSNHKKGREKQRRRGLSEYALCRGPTQEGDRTMIKKPAQTGKG